ncbi:head GIN domain-containing protein [Corallococcus macrosporus]|uniref:Putative lipoprotein n=1 Tax=Myxococcus fulvus (strain ATCC BAA-855 / HW-1) TaxID=483219 RepID=F8CFM7_MYXFH|nr:head GIN domain-containing protein [Corallococcus macrosporus]AEI63637.1 putative lipoprotein [Corallococcus macrosporus]
MSPARVSIVASLLLFGACAHAQDSQANASAQGRGDVREVPDFNEVSVSHGIRAEVKVGPKSVRLEGPAELLSRIQLEVDDDGTLKTRVAKRTFSGFRGGNVRLYVSNPRVEGISASGGSHVEADATRAEDFDVEASGGAIVTVRGVDARKVEAEASGGSQVTLAGRATEFDAEASGGSAVRALDVKGVKTLDTEASGGSRVEVDASERVTGEASGGSILQLVSRPGQSDVRTSGGSRLIYKD